MGEVQALKRKHYTGLDADKASVTGIDGESYYATDKDKHYYWTGGGWKTGLGYEFVPRSPEDPDVIETGLTTDGTWKVNGLDLSGIVPVGAVAVVLFVYLLDDATNSQFFIRQNATKDKALASLRTQVANIALAAHSIIAIDSDRLLDYFGSNLAFMNIEITVLGWYI